MLKEQITVTWEDLFVGGAAGIMIETAQVLISYSIDVGLAGPSAAIESTDVIY